MKARCRGEPHRVDTDGGLSHRLQGDQKILIALVILIVLGQRFAIPAPGGGQVSLTVVGALGLTCLGVGAGSFKISRRQSLFLGVAFVAIGTSSAIQYLMGIAASPLSLLLLVLIYLPAVTVAGDRFAARVGLTFFVDMMLVLAAIGLALFVIQYAGVPFQDYLARIVPQQFLQQGYNTSYPLSFGSSIYRSNGVLFLEASFYSFFLAIAVLISIFFGHRRLWTPLLIAAMASTASGNGIVVLAVGLLGMLFTSRGRRSLARIAGVLLVPIAIVAATPLGPLLLSRFGELGASDSSANLRAVDPYRILVPAALRSTSSLVFGNGPGSAQVFYQDNVLDAFGMPSLLAPPGAKLLFEFGLVGSLPMMLFLVVTLGRTIAQAPWVPGILVVYFGLNASLQQPTIAAASLLFSSILGPAMSVASAGGPSPAASGSANRFPELPPADGDRHIGSDEPNSADLGNSPVDQIQEGSGCRGTKSQGS